jgi:hypothetical protein
MMEQAMAQRNRAYSRASLSLTHPNAAGIDIGSASHYVAVPPDRDDEPVREFPSFTADLQHLADWLDGCGVDTVAMESTGVYWIPLYELLDARGFTVLLVNARHVKNVSGRKSDVLDCQWLQQLMSYGLRERVQPTKCAPCARCRASADAAAVRRGTSAHAEGTHPDEHPAGQCHLRRGRRDRTEDPARDHRR